MWKILLFILRVSERILAFFAPLYKYTDLVRKGGNTRGNEHEEEDYKHAADRVYAGRRGAGDAVRGLEAFELSRNRLRIALSAAE